MWHLHPSEQFEHPPVHPEVQIMAPAAEGQGQGCHAEAVARNQAICEAKTAVEKQNTESVAIGVHASP